MSMSMSAVIQSATISSRVSGCSMSSFKVSQVDSSCKSTHFLSLTYCKASMFQTSLSVMLIEKD